MAEKSAPQPAPWEAAAPHEQLFILITGANSGIGLGIGERLIDEFLATRSLTSHLILLPTTRSPSKSKATIKSLRSHALLAAKSSSLLSRGDTNAASRIHVLSLQLDLCDLRGVYALADRLCESTISNPDGTEGQDKELRDVKVPRLDSVVFNAAYGGWSGCDYPQAVWKMLTDGFIQSVTWPTFKMALPTCILNERPVYKYPIKPLLGEVFTACVFGHYLLAHALLPLLTRPPTQQPGRIIWSSSVEAVRDVFNLKDIQALKSLKPYESAKRLTDVLALTSTLPSVRPHISHFLSDDDENEPPKMYLTHPGVVASSLFPLPWFLFWAYELALVFARWIGSPWHTVDSYSGAKSAAWICLQEQPALDALDADRIKWGSASNHKSEVMVKKTEVEDWGWAGKVEDLEDEEGVEGVLRKRIGRRRGVVDVAKEDLVEFEELGAQVWEQMERLRDEWESTLDL